MRIAQRNELVSMTVKTRQLTIQDEVDDLERRLKDAKQRLKDSGGTVPPPAFEPSIPLSSPHSLLLLSDSALPLGSFAYSSGLESYIAHNKPLPPGTTPTTSFHNFLSLSLASIASTTLPYLLTAHRHPDQLEALDNDLDASTPCTVARRASIAQGLALLGVWERAFREPYSSTDTTNPTTRTAISALSSFSELLKATPPPPSDPSLGANGHLAPLWAVVCVALGIDISHSAYIYMLNHAKAVLSAAVRASVMGPYQAQGVLASRWLQDVIAERVEGQWGVGVEEAGQAVPVVDLWVGRHELLYSRIFNS
ncbi:hypothetical protein FQN52_004629 [Onygenales sp. PD_12]|nr:hypothetical protein FQN53_001768 [Emmonsiellopsis sp. PD_33]KAK2791713.1 hypothetical protein FQN52_004629 [Onygenales sp. PD_12]KAK2796939.1 hypothetical protein FQN51_008905 [Onygenales sp. PD_10]